MPGTADSTGDSQAPLSARHSLLLPFNLSFFFSCLRREPGWEGLAGQALLSEVDSACMYLCSQAERPADSTM